jgi:hypothetical protein
MSIYLSYWSKHGFHEAYMVFMIMQLYNYHYIIMYVDM